MSTTVSTAIYNASSPVTSSFAEQKRSEASTIGDDYRTSSETLEQKAERKLSQSNTTVLAGFGCGLKVCKDALVVRQGFTHSTQSPQKTLLHRGVHSIKSILILSDSGNITLDALSWCESQNISISIIDNQGNLKETLGCKPISNATLRRKQYTLSNAEISHICYRIICKKTQAQFETLEQHSELPENERAKEIFTDAMKWLELPDLPRWKDTNYIRQFEGRLAGAYFEALYGLPIKWDKAVVKSIPPHWQKITERTSPLSHNHGARHATNPFQAALNYAYAVLESQCRQALVVMGFDVACGLLHSDKLYRDSLVYDLMECYRPNVDHLVLKFFASTTFKKGDFIQRTDGSLSINPQLCRYIVATCQINQNQIETGVKWLKNLMQTN